MTGLMGAPFYLRPNYILDELTFPQVLFSTLAQAEWQHEERSWQMQSLALATAAGAGGSKEATAAIERFAKRKLGQRRRRTFSEMLAEERVRAGGQ